MNNYISSHIVKIDEVYTIQTSTELSYTGISITIPENSYYSLSVSGIYNNSKPELLIISTSDTDKNTFPYIECGPVNNHVHEAFSGYTTNIITFYIWAKYNKSAENGFFIDGFYLSI